MNGLSMAFVKIVEDNDFALGVVGHFFGRNAPDVTSSANEKYFPVSHRTSRTLWSRSRTASYDLKSERLWMWGRGSAKRSPGRRPPSTTRMRGQRCICGEISRAQRTPVFREGRLSQNSRTAL